MDYQEKSAQALARINGTLEQEGARLAANLVTLGDTDGAKDLSEQIKAKTSGKPVEKPHSAAIQLFRMYDSARQSTLKPVQAASVAKIEALLKSSAGKDMTKVLELANVRKEIEGGKTTSVEPKKTDEKKGVVELHEAWTWHMKSTGGPSGSIKFKRGGELEQMITGRSKPTLGTWKKTKIPNVYSLYLDFETIPMTVEGSTATLEMSIGTRYLRMIRDNSEPSEEKK